MHSNIKGNTLYDCLYIPSFAVSLISVHCLCCKSMEVSFSRHTCSVRLHQQTVPQGQHHSGLYHLGIIPLINKAQANLAVDINIVHHQMGHAAHECIQHLVTYRRLKHIDLLTRKPEFCEPCVMGKMHKLPFKSKETYQATRPLEIIHSDIGGPITPATQEGYRCWITFIDRYTHFTWVHLTKQKSDAQAAYNEWRVISRPVFAVRLGMSSSHQIGFTSFALTVEVSIKARHLRSSYVLKAPSMKLLLQTHLNRMT
jgi:hypothetical protein